LKEGLRESLRDIIGIHEDIHRFSEIAVHEDKPFTYIEEAESVNSFIKVVGQIGSQGGIKVHVSKEFVLALLHLKQISDGSEGASMYTKVLKNIGELATRVKEPEAFSIKDPLRRFIEYQVYKSG